MTSRTIRSIVAVALIVSGCSSASPPSSPARANGDALPPGTVFDDFVGFVGQRPDSTLWDYDVGPYQDAGLQTYTSKPENVRLDGQGHLLIQAMPTDSGYASARPVTRGKLEMLYGRVSARIKFPEGQGVWPAFWMLGADMDQVGWPKCGEIDLMEVVNEGGTYHVTLHGPQGDTDYFGGADKTGQVVGTSGPIENLSADFHDYWLDWRPNSITIGVDDRTLGAFTPASLPPGAVWVFDKPMYALLNIAVGGPWPGPPDASTTFPATMLVDWFRYEPYH